MDKYIIEEAMPEELLERAVAIIGENLELQRTVEELRGRLREARRSANHYRTQYKEAMRYQFDAESDRQRDRARLRELMVAVGGAAVLMTCLLFVGAVCWGWWFG